MLAECELLREYAAAAGVVMDDGPGSLGALDQLPPRWREDPAEREELGTDAGLCLGTVVVRSVAGARWGRDDAGLPVVVLATGREVDVVGCGRLWAEHGSPGLAQVHAEAAEHRGRDG
ncbi:hypothetical protein HCJ92_03685 [Streptomyces sp. ventii]|uniref:Uncharacterized protein n=1 Tax=Streptomyces spiramenti TaxID=2720606 RepID=A0ABX1ADW1_9ACTN|nr:hypothetical protein [Streptomyces spiramenti]